VTRRESRTRPAPTAPAPLPASPVVVATAAPTRTAARIGWGVALVWIAALATLAFTAANPVTVNLRQVQDADLVVAARVVDRAAGTCSIEEQLTPGPPLTSITVDNLKQAHAAKGELLLLPLQHRSGDRYSIVPAHLSGAPPLVYPATPEVIARVKQILGK